MWKLDIKIMYAEAKLRTEDSMTFNTEDEAVNYIAKDMFLGEEAPYLIMRRHVIDGDNEYRFCGSHGKLLVTLRLHKLKPEPPKEIG